MPAAGRVVGEDGAVAVSGDDDVVAHLALRVHAPRDAAVIAAARMVQHDHGRGDGASAFVRGVQPALVVSLADCGCGDGCGF